MIYNKPLTRVAGSVAEGFWWECDCCNGSGETLPTYRDAYHDPERYRHNCQAVTKHREICPVCGWDVPLDVLGRFIDHFKTDRTTEHCPGFGWYPRRRDALKRKVK